VTNLCRSGVERGGGPILGRVRLTRKQIRGIQQDQLDASPNEDMRPYAGQFVAIRKGCVVAAHFDVRRLVEDPRYREGDVIAPVPERFDLELIL
jgi:hypothetical protein